MRVIFIYLLLSVTHVCLATDATAPTSMVYRYWDWGITKNRDDYQVAALTLALEKTLSTHGPYDIIRIEKAFNNADAMREMKAGRINIQVAPIRSRNHQLAHLTQDISIAIEIPLIQGLLGYRRLIVRTEQLELFKNITTAQLKAQLAGQGKDWEEVYIYRHNKFRINDDGDYLALAHMLAAKRFDYLPLSVTEADLIVAQADNATPLAIVPNLMIYYPLPLYFFVSKLQPELAERLEAGLQRAKQDGSLDALFNQHFRSEVTFLKDNRNARVILLENPSVPEHIGLNKPLFLDNINP